MNGKDIILGLLLEKSRTGYEIHQVFETVFTHFYKSSYGMIYPTLKKLEKNGLVVKKIIHQEGKPSKNIFSITDLGIEEFKKYLDTDIAIETRESEFMVRMYLGSFATEDVLQKWIEQEISLKEAAISQLEMNYVHWENVMSFTQKITYEIGRKQYEVEIEILKERLIALKRAIQKG